jgi:tetratricopeptide (TPR) repeat protein
VYLQSGDAVKLRQSLRKLAEKESDSFVIRKKLLELAVAGGDWDDAVRWGREALHIDVMDADVHASLGRAFSKQKKYTEAVEEFEIAVQVSPTDPDLRVLFAETLAQAGQEQQAIRVLEQLLAKYPQHEPAKRLLAHLTEQKL